MRENQINIKEMLMKNILKVLALILLLSLIAPLKSYGQSQKEPGIWVPQWRAKLIVLDKLKLTQFEVYEIPSLVRQIKLLEANAVDQKIIDANKDQEIRNLKSDILLGNEQQANSVSIAEEWEKMYKKEKRMKFLVGGTGIVIIVLLTLVSL